MIQKSVETRFNRTMRIALAVSPEFQRRGPTKEDDLLSERLATGGMEVVFEAWDGASDWAAYDAILIRSCWDYHLHPAEFREWLDRVEQAGTLLWNPAPLVRWNMDKRYLEDLQAEGLTVVPTVFRPTLSEDEVESFLGAFQVDELVIKPSIGATAFQTHRVVSGGLFPDLEPLAGAAVWLVQPFLHEIVRDGEWSLIWLENRFSHAALKKAPPGDFRVQESCGGSATLCEPDHRVMELAARTIEALEPAPLYARVDIVVHDEVPMLMEVELIEPQLFLERSPAGLERFVGSIERSLGEGSGWLPAML